MNPKFAAVKPTTMDESFKVELGNYKIPYVWLGIENADKPQIGKGTFNVATYTADELKTLSAADITKMIEISKLEGVDKKSFEILRLLKPLYQLQRVQSLPETEG